MIDSWWAGDAWFRSMGAPKDFLSGGRDPYCFTAHDIPDDDKWGGYAPSMLSMEKPLGKSSKNCMYFVCCLGAVQVLKLLMTCSLCSINIILIPMLSSNTGVYLPLCSYDCLEEVADSDLKLASEGNKWKAMMIDPMFRWTSSEIQVREALTQQLCCAVPSWVIPCVSKLNQSCGEGSQAFMVSAVWLSG